MALAVVAFAFEPDVVAAVAFVAAADVFVGPVRNAVAFGVDAVALAFVAAAVAGIWGGVA